MNWAEVMIHTTNEAAEAVANLLHEAGSSGVAIEDSRDLGRVWGTTYGEVYQLNPDDYPKDGVILKGYFPVTKELEQRLQKVRTHFLNLESTGLNLGRRAIHVSEIQEEDWANGWKQYYKPEKLTSTLTVAPSWENYKRNDDEKVIELDPGMAFGTGTHPTTVLSVRALENVITKDDVVIDVGTGTGILSIASALFGARHVYAYDLDELAVKSATLNIQRNNQQDKITVQQNDLLSGVQLEADVIVANLLADIVIRLAGDAGRVLRKDGCLIASGIVKNQQHEVEEKLISSGFSIENTLELEGWIAIVAKFLG